MPNVALMTNKSSKARSPCSGLFSNKANQPIAASGRPHAIKTKSWIGMIATANSAAARSVEPSPAVVCGFDRKRIHGSAPSELPTARSRQ